jgi:hypothetical protein
MPTSGYQEILDQNILHIGMVHAKVDQKLVKSNKITSFI